MVLTTKRPHTFSMRKTQLRGFYPFLARVVAHVLGVAVIALAGCDPVWSVHIDVAVPAAIQQAHPDYPAQVVLSFTPTQSSSVLSGDQRIAVLCVPGDRLVASLDDGGVGCASEVTVTAYLSAVTSGEACRDLLAQSYIYDFAPALTDARTTGVLYAGVNGSGWCDSLSDSLSLELAAP